MTNYYVLLHTNSCLKKNISHLSDDWDVVGIFLHKLDAQENIKNENQYHILEIEGSEAVDDEAQKYLIGNSDIFCLIRYEKLCVVVMEVLCVSDDVDEIIENCQNDTPDMGIYEYEYTYCYSRFDLNHINYEADNIHIQKEKYYDYE